MTETKLESAASNGWRRVCATRDFPRDGGRSYRIGSIPVAVFRSEGKWYATGAYCTHEEEELAEGWLEGCNVECPRHGAMFDMRTGEAVSLPATEPLAVYPIEIRGEDVFVDVSVHEAEARTDTV